MKIIVVLIGAFLGAVIGFVIHAVFGSELSEMWGVTGFESVAYFEFFVLMPLYTFVGMFTGACTAFAVVPSKRERRANVEPATTPSQ